jgi:hypothetical protein
LLCLLKIKEWREWLAIKNHHTAQTYKQAKPIHLINYNAKCFSGLPLFLFKKEENYHQFSH